METQISYWQQQLQDCPELLQLPTDRSRPNIQTYTGKTQRFTLNQGLTQKLQKLSTESGTTLFITLLAGFATLLYRYSGQSDILIGSPVVNCHHQEIDLFINTLVFRSNFSGNPSFLSLLHEVKETTTKAYENQDIPWEKVVEALQPEISLSHSPIFQVMFILESQLGDELESTIKTCRELNQNNTTAKCDLTVSMTETLQGLEAEWEYNTELWDDSTIERMGSHFENLLSAIVADPHQTVNELPLLSETERHQLLVEWNNTQTAYPQDKCIHQLFEEQVELTPNAIAVVFEHQQLTYLELNEKANQVAHYLQRLGVVSDAIVGIFVERSLEMIAGLLGILKAGGAYLPLDPNYPAERLSYMLTNSRLEVLLTQQDLLSFLPSSTAQIVCLDKDWGLIEQSSRENVSTEVGSENFAYVIYTSGSTGQPKGVTMNHRPLVNLILWQLKQSSAKYGTKTGQFTPISFDVSFQEIFATLCSGGILVLITEEIRRDGTALLKLLTQQAIERLFLPFVALEQLAQSAANSESLPKNLQELITAGEQLKITPALTDFFNKLPNCRLENQYGPTESHVVTAFSLQGSPHIWQSLPPIGKPIANAKIYILDKQLQPVPIGVSGELYIGGDALARGYLHRPELTNERFISNPFGGGFLYKTGDLARYLIDGNIEYLGRIDNQVKIRGFRIELGEIEAVINNHPQVQQTVVIVREDTPRNKRLVAYVVPNSNNSLTSNQELDATQVSQWQQIWNTNYSQSLSEFDPTFNTVGWRDSYTGLPIPKQEMRQWLDTTVERILRWKPDRVLEIGCGTGMLLFQIAPKCSYYLGTDFSAQVLSYLEQQIENLDGNWSQVSLSQRTADDFEGIEPCSFDTVIINSVIELFPSINYLIDVLEKAIQVVKTGGIVFLGDIRSLSLLEAFYAKLEFNKASDLLSIKELEQYIFDSMGKEDQLLLDPDFFTALKQHLPSISHVLIKLKRGRYYNEITKFRYDVILHIEKEVAATPEVQWLDWQKNEITLSQVRDLLIEKKPEFFVIKNIRNPRLSQEIKLLDLLRSETGVTTVGDLKEALQEIDKDGIEPEDWWALGEELSRKVYLNWSEVKGCYDVVFQTGEKVFSNELNNVEFRPWITYANNPLQSQMVGNLAQILRADLKKCLPDYMIPTAFVILDKMPLTPSGKVDRRSLKAPEKHRPELSTVLVIPRTDNERLIAKIWQEILQLDVVGIHDNFFELGGHSLVATQVISRLREAFGIEIPLRVIFESPTIAELDRALSQLLILKKGLNIPALKPVAKNLEEIPLSFQQERLWFIDQLEGANATYNIPIVLSLTGNLEINLLEKALSEILQRHEVLRTSFQTIDGTARQIINPELTLNIKVTDLQHIQKTERQTVLEKEVRQAINIPFNLEIAPLIRGNLWQLAPTEYVLLITMHHIVSDGWSIGIFYQELSALYKAFLAGKSSPLEKLPVQYADFSLWEKQWLRGELLQTQLNYWRQQLQNAPELLQLPTDRPRPNIQTHKGKTQRFLLNRELTQKIQNLANESGQTLFMTLWAAFATLLYRYSGQSDILIGSSIANRNRSEIESLIGFFVNTLVLRSNFEDNPSFLELLNQVKETTLKAYEHQDVLLEQVLPSQRSLSYSYLFQVMFILQPPEVELELPGITCHQLYQESVVSKFDLTVSMTETFQGLEAEWEYKTDLWDDSTIKRMAGHFENLLSAVVAHPYQTVNQLQLLSKNESNQLLVEWNQTQSEYPQDKCIHQLFEEQVELTPNAIALVFCEQQLTYFELNQKANQVAHYLQILGVKPEELVGICVERSLEMIIGLLGILKAGGAYVPLDPNYPAERLSYMLTNSKVDVLLTQQDLLSSLPSTPGQIVCLDKDWGVIEKYSNSPLNTDVSSNNLAYVIYTSGSTGQPKGVMIEHRSLVKAYWGWEKAYQLKSTTTCHLQLANFSFDVFTGDWVRALCSGAKLVLCPSEIRTDPAQLYNLMRYQKVDFAEFVPALIRPLVEYLEQTQQLLDFMQILIVGSDIWYMGEYGNLVNYCGSNSRVINSYGITECTIDSTFFEDKKNSIPEQALVPIGRPMSNTKIYILDQQLQPVPIGVIGELYIGGDGLARGYLNRPELTQEKFIANPFQTGERIYKTGDIARYLNDGNIEYLDRIDNQVKIRGFRIELGEIESVINTHPQIQQTVVIAREDIPGNKRIVAYIVGDNARLNTGEVREYLKQKLPEYMVPSAFMFLKDFPLTPNGKIDRKALPVPDLDLSSEGKLIFPRDTIELKLEQIWSDLLGIYPIGVKNNFFELGGHSLLAVRLMSQIQQQFHKKLSLATLFQNSTIEQIAHMLRQETDLDWSVLVPIKSQGNKPPLFCIHPSGGNVLCYQDLAYQLDLEQPVYGLQSFGLNPENEPHSSIEQMASYYIQAIQTVQPHGPYFLFGWSLGGIVAFEMAQQLSRQGEQIAFLASVDSDPLFTTSELENDDAVLMVWLLGQELEPCLSEIQQLAPQEKLLYMLEQAKQKNLVPEEFDLAEVQHLLEINKLNILALGKYQPQLYSGAMIVIQASETETDLASVWNEFVEELHTDMIPGNHYNLVRPPQVQRLAQILQKYLAGSRL